MWLYLSIIGTCLIFTNSKGGNGDDLRYSNFSLLRNLLKLSRKNERWATLPAEARSNI